MFTNAARRSSQKRPSEELFRNFRANHPEVGHGQPVNDAATTTAASQQSAAAIATNVDSSLESRTNDQHSHDARNAIATPRGANESWSFGSTGLTPLQLDPNDHNFQLFDHLNNFYPPTPGGLGHSSTDVNSYLHQHGGHYSASGFGGMGMSTPLSMPTSESAVHTAQQPFHGFNNHHNHQQQQMQQHQAQQHQFQNADPFHMHQQSFPPHHFTNQPSHQSLDYEGPIGESPVEDLAMSAGASHYDHNAHTHFEQQHQSTSIPGPSADHSSEKFRYHTTLNAPTAMVAHSDDVPVTYLNKGQAYTLNVVDTQAQPARTPRRYRTFVRVSFQDEQQRQKPAQCWQLWKEGRGTNEAHHRGGRLQAVEYVPATNNISHEDLSKPQFELESSSFDGFCVVWTSAAGSVECPISVRFNFLSTDFSHSKGVKGIPVRLCAKTQLLDDGIGNWSQVSDAEVCYCMVKLFRDHGAERKLSNDVAHVKKTIEKLNQQIAQIESGLKEGGKRKRSGSMARVSSDTRPSKVAKHRRSWSMNSATSNSGRGSVEEDLHKKLLALQDRFSSTRPASVLHLRGDKDDDPDASPVALSDSDDLLKPPELTKNESTESGLTHATTITDGEQTSPIVSPISSNNSPVSLRKDSSMQQHTPLEQLSRADSEDWRSNPQTAVMDLLPTIRETSDDGSITAQVQTRSPRSGTVRGTIEVSGVDINYEPPQKRPIRPVACVYILPRVEGQSPSDPYYRAVYISQRTLKDFVNAVASKCGVEPTSIRRTIRQRRDTGAAGKGKAKCSAMEVLFDDECVREISEGQDMTVCFVQAPSLDEETSSFKQEKNTRASLDIQCDSDLPTLKHASDIGYNLILQF